MSTPELEIIARLYRSQLLIRRTEEHICAVYHTDAIKSPVHLSIGQESVAVGVCDPLEPDDIVSNTYRCHATYIAKGGDLKQMMAELYGKASGCAAGKAGSMHLIDMKHGILGASAVVGTTIPVAAGYALGLMRDAAKTGRQRLVVSVFGDGATEEGVFSETVQFAALKKLPIIFVCENNRLAIHSKIESRWPSDIHVRERVKACGLPVHFIPDADIFAIRNTVMAAAESVRKGKGPVFIECMTYRWLEHVGPTDDHEAGYRDRKEYESWKANDQVMRLEKILGDDAVAPIKADVEAELNAAIAYAESSAYPKPDALLKNVYAA